MRSLSTRPVAAQRLTDPRVHSLLTTLAHAHRRLRVHFLTHSRPLSNDHEPRLCDAPAPAHPVADAIPIVEPTENELATRAMQEVVPGFWLGALEATQFLSALRARGLDCVVSAIDLPDFEVDGVRRHLQFARRQLTRTARRRSRTTASSSRITRARTSWRTSSPRSRSSRRRLTVDTACSCTASTGKVRAAALTSP
jgi:hypothetical protein